MALLTNAQISSLDYKGCPSPEASVFSPTVKIGSRLKYLDTSGGIDIAGGAWTSCPVSIGDFHSETHGSGVALSDTVTKALDVLADDGNAAIASAVRASRSRVLVTRSHTGGSVFGAQNQVKIVPSASSGSQSIQADNLAGSWNYIEISRKGTATVTASGVLAASLAQVSVETASMFTLPSGQYLGGFVAESKFATGQTFSGTCAAFLAKAHPSFASAVWPVGLWMSADQVKQGLVFEGGTSADTGTTGTVMSVGASGNNVILTTADQCAIKAYVKHTATSGDNRLLYLRFDQNGAGGGGECVRAFSVATAALGTARGAHISLNVSQTGYVSGLGVGCDSQLYVGDSALPSGGTYFAGQSEVYMEGSSSDISAASAHAIHSFVANGDATGVGTVLNALAFKGSVGSGKMIFDQNSSGGTESNGCIRILVDEGAGYQVRYLRYWDNPN